MLPDAVYGILDKFGCDISLLVKDFFVIAMYVLFKPVYLGIGFLGGTAFPCQTVCLGIPQVRLHLHFRGELRNLGVDGNSAHKWAQSVLLHLLSVDIEQYGKSIVSGLSFLFHGFILLVRLTSFRMAVSACSSSVSLNLSVIRFCSLPISSFTLS